MSFIGNFAAAQSAKAIGKYNASVYQQQAALQKRKTEVNRAVYNQVDRPRLVKQQESQYDALFVNLLKSGAEFRTGTTPYLVGLEQKINFATDLAIEDYNSRTAYFDGINQSLLLESKGIGEAFKGQMTARAETIKGLSKMGQNYYTSGGTSLLG